MEKGNADEIKNNEKGKELIGLFIELNDAESRRIDNQLRGRSGSKGTPEAQFSS